MRKVFLRRMIKGMTVVCIILGWFSLALSAEIKLAWDANIESDLAGYNVYYGTASHSYGSPVNVGKVTSYTLTGLTSGQTYYIALTAYDSSSNESGPSNEVSGVATAPSQTVAVTVTTSPAGRQMTVDGTTFTAPQTFNWTTGSSHTVGVSSPQNGTAGTRYVFASWSDGGTQTHTVSAPAAAATYTATFTTQYSLTTGGSPGGTVSPSGTNWYNNTQSVTLTATPNAGYGFSNWSGDLTGSSNPASITMNGPKSVTANFSAISGGTLAVTPPDGFNSSGRKGGPFSPGSSTYTLQNSGGAVINWTAASNQNWTDLSATSGTLSPGESAAVAVSINANATSLGLGTYDGTVTFTNTTNHNGDTTRPVKLAVVAGDYQTHRIATSPGGLSIEVDGTRYKSPKKFKWEVGSPHTISVATPQEASSGKRYQFNSWSDGGLSSHTVVSPAEPTTYTADFITEFSMKTSVNDTSSGTVSPSGIQWYEKGQTVSISAVPAEGYRFKNWKDPLGQVVGKDNPLSLTMDGAKKIKANFVRIKYPLVVNKVPASGGTVSKTPSKTKYFQGETVILKAKPSYGYNFTGWEGDATGSEYTISITVDGPKTITAGFVVDPNVPRVAPESAKTDERLPLIGQLESPADGRTFSGVKPIYGWALDGETVAKVELFIDGQYVCQIPYGGLREDIRDAHPAYPGAEESGFALVWNYSVLPAGEHTIGIKLHNSRDETLDLSARISVTKFQGDVVTDVNSDTPYSFPVTVTADGVTRTYEVNLQWLSEIQDFGIVEIIPQE